MKRDMPTVHEIKETKDDLEEIHNKENIDYLRRITSLLENIHSKITEQETEKEKSPLEDLADKFKSLWNTLTGNLDVKAPEKEKSVEKFEEKEKEPEKKTDNVLDKFIADINLLLSKIEQIASLFNKTPVEKTKSPTSSVENIVPPTSVKSGASKSLVPEITEAGEAAEMAGILALAKGGDLPKEAVAIVGDKENENISSSDTAELVMKDESSPSGISVVSNKEMKQMMTPRLHSDETNIDTSTIPHFAGGTGTVSKALSIPTIAGAGKEGPVSTFESLAGTGGAIASMLGPEVQAVYETFHILVDTIMDAVQAFNKLAESLRQYSPEITSAMAESEIYKMSKDIQKAEERGPEMAKLYSESSKLWEDIKMILFDMGKPIIEILIPTVEFFRGFIQGIAPLIGVIAEFFTLSIRFFADILNGETWDKIMDNMGKTIYRVYQKIRGETATADFITGRLSGLEAGFGSVGNAGFVR